MTRKEYYHKLKPENRFYPITSNFTTEASIHTNLLRDLYIVLGEGNLSDGWVVRIYYNPLVIWIWIGALAIFLGGIVTMTNNLKKLKSFIEMKKQLLILPSIFFLLILLIFFYLLIIDRNPSELPSTLLDKNVQNLKLSLY